LALFGPNLARNPSADVGTRQLLTQPLAPTSHPETGPIALRPQRGDLSGRSSRPRPVSFRSFRSADFWGLHALRRLRHGPRVSGDLHRTGQRVAPRRGSNCAGHGISLVDAHRSNKRPPAKTSQGEVDPTQSQSGTRARAMVRQPDATVSGRTSRAPASSSIDGIVRASQAASGAGLAAVLVAR